MIIQDEGCNSPRFKHCILDCIVLFVSSDYCYNLLSTFRYCIAVYNFYIICELLFRGGKKR